MDDADFFLDNPNIPPFPSSSMPRQKKTVPTYALYGENLSAAWPEGFHCESIAQRSRLYNWEIRPHRHAHFAQFLIIRSGSGTSRFDDAESRLDAPCALFVPGGCVHGFRFSRDIDGTVITVVSRWLDRVLAGMPDLAACFAAPRHIDLGRHPEDVARIGRQLQTLLDEWSGGGPWRGASMEAAFSLLVIALGRAGGLPATAPGSRAEWHVRRYAALIEQSFRVQRDIGNYAGQLSLTPTQLNRVCRQVLGLSALGALNRRLLIEAQRDLAYTSLSIKAIALTLGFADAAYFTRFFTRQAGSSPTRYREESRRQFEKA